MPARRSVTSGILHLAADALHLLAAAAWIGGLVSLVLAARRSATPSDRRIGVALRGTRTARFSTLGIVSVATLLVTGIVNAWILVGSFHALVVTGYGRLLMLKLCCLRRHAGVRCGEPVLADATACRVRQATSCGSMRSVSSRATASIEIALGFTIFAIVGVLGTLHPAIHFM